MGARLGGRMVFIVLFAAAEVRAHAVEAFCLLPAETNPSAALVHVCNKGRSVLQVRLSLKRFSPSEK